MTIRRCRGCSTLEKPVFYDTRLHECPECRTSKYPFNVHLRCAYLNRHTEMTAAGVPYDGPIV